ncbi:MAG: MarR family transcriptional regulator [Bacillota bacterium]|nr:MarR family transcriptional regulator [Bacillota bacterium]MDW7684861.1 MarR family transcriptional regulator [Bacillota bacterium]
MEHPDKSGQLRELIRILERKLGGMQENQLSCCSITLPQCHALVEIGRAGKMSLNELAELLRLEKSTMSRTVSNLVSANLAKRVEDAQDRRYVAITLTDSGKKLFAGIEAGMNDYYRRIYLSMPANKREQVLASLQVLLDAISFEYKGDDYPGEC